MEMDSTQGGKRSNSEDEFFDRRSPTMSSGRTNVKEASTTAQRRAMNLRRHELSAQIRKARRSHIVQLKRRFMAKEPSDGDDSLASENGMGALMGESGEPLSTVATNNYWASIATARSAMFGNGWSSSSTTNLTGNSNAMDQGTHSTDQYDSHISTAITVKLNDLASAYLRAIRVGTPQTAAAALHIFQSILAKTPTQYVSSSLSSWLLPMEPADESFGGRRDQKQEADTPKAFLLAQSLADTILSRNSDCKVRLDAAKVLTNLAATEHLQPQNVSGGQELDYYNGQQMLMLHPEGWCDVFLETRVLSALIEVNTTFVSSSSTSPSSSSISFIATSQETIDLCSQCCWALGNLAGDSQTARDATRDSGGIEALIRTMRLAFQLASYSSLMALGLCRNAAWALSNIARGSFTSAMPFLAMPTSMKNDLGHDYSPWLLTHTDFFEFITCPERFQQMFENPKISCQQDDSSSWFDVCFEICWVLAFLTAREDEVVDFLCFQTDFSIIAAVVYRLSQAVSCIAAINSIRISIPLIRIIGNIATASDGRYVTSLLSASFITLPSSDASTSFTPLSHSLAKLIEAGAQEGAGSDMAAIACEAAWAAGTLLCDAGYPHPHPSTAAVSILMAPLLQAVTSGSSRLEMKREAVAALRNAIAAPPLSSKDDSSTMEGEGLELQTMEVRDAILSQLALSRGTIRSLVELLKTSDSDAIHSALQLIHAIIHRLGHLETICILLDEANCRDALESICDRASMSPSIGQDYWKSGSKAGLEQCADIAADLIDDFFEANSQNEIDDSGQFSGCSYDLNYMTSQPPTSDEYHSDVMNVSNQGIKSLGRGRALVTPAWMQRTDSLQQGL